MSEQLKVALYSLPADHISAHAYYLQLKSAPISDKIPVHIIAVIDTSGSMNNQNKLENVKKSLDAVVDVLGPSDLFSLITFNSKSYIHIKCAGMAEDGKYAARSKIKSMTATSATNLSAGLLNAASCILGADDGLTRNTSILLLTDGEANAGVTDPDALLDTLHDVCAAGASSSRVSVHTFGYGTDHNSRLLAMIADARSGGYNVVNSLEDVASAIANAFGSIAFSSLQNITVSGASKYMTGYITDDNGINIGDMIAEATTGVLINDDPCGPIKVNGYYIQSTGQFSQISVECDRVVEAPREVVDEARMLWLRLKVANLLERRASAHLEEYDELLDLLDDETGGIIKIMRREVEVAKSSLDPFRVFAGNVARVAARAHIMMEGSQAEAQAQAQALGAPRRDDNDMTQQVTFFRNLRSIGANDVSMITSPVAQEYSQRIYNRATQNNSRTCDPVPQADE